MDLPVPQALSETDRPIRRAVRRLHWFKNSFAQQVQVISEGGGVEYRIRNDRIARTFLEWLRAFEAQKPHSPSARRSYVNFASGLMLRQLIRDNPLEVISIPVDADITNPAYFWPEGYVYVAYCLNVRSLVLEQEFDETLHLTPEFKDIHTWWSFRENVAQDTSRSIGFLDLFCGENPEWSFPSYFRLGGSGVEPERIAGGGTRHLDDERPA